MPDQVKIQVLGLKEFRGDLKAANVLLPRELRKVFNAAATAVVADAKAKVPRRSGALAGTIQARSTSTEGRVTMGSEKVPYAGFIEFGGHVGKGRKGKGTGSVSRPFIRTGRYLYPAFLRHQLEVLAAMEGLLRDLAKRIEA